MQDETEQREAIKDALKSEAERLTTQEVAKGQAAGILNPESSDYFRHYKPSDREIRMQKREQKEKEARRKNEEKAERARLQLEREERIANEKRLADEKARAELKKKTRRTTATN